MFDDDPLARALAPPPDESPPQAAARVLAERAAAKRSADIDRQLRQDAPAAHVRTAKILLLGQSESGKSTVLKNFQRKYDPAAFDRERAAWRAVCQRNVARCFAAVLDVLRAAPDTALAPAHRAAAQRLAHVLPRDADADAAALAHALAAARADMAALWADPAVRALVRARLAGLDDLSGSVFLDDLARIADPGYAPTEDDVLRARLATTGVTQHHFVLRDHRSVSEVRIYDVGGARNQRHTWMPFFDDVNAIVFLAPLGAFDQMLAEAPSINRLEDTLTLWRATCRAPLLARVPLVLLLNKRDVLQRKLNAGVRFARFVRSYRGEERWEDVVKYLKTKFKAMHRELSPEPRMFYAHVTCATDKKQMAIILSAIEDVVLRRNLTDVKLL